MKLFQSTSIEKVLKKEGITDLSREKINQFLESIDLLSLWNSFQGNQNNTEVETIPGDNSVDNQCSHSISLKNGMVDRDYHAKVDLPDEGVKGISVVKSPGMDNISFNEETGELTFLPTISGDTTIELEYSLQKRILLNFHVNEEPKKMWKDIPSEGAVKPDNEFRQLENEDYLMITASRRGRSHAHEGSPRDDHFELAIHEGWAISIVADGAGSAENSSLGSKIVCETCLENIRRKITAKREGLHLPLKKKDNKDFGQKIRKVLYDVLVASSHDALLELHKTAKEQNMPIRDLSTTLSIAIMKKTEQRYFVGTFQVGDGNISLLDKKQVSNLCIVDKGSQRNQTCFLNTKDVFKNPEDLLKRLFISTPGKPLPLMLMTDGVVDGKFPNPDGISEDNSTWNTLWQDLNENVFSKNNQAEMLLDWLNFYEEGEHDDRTLSIILPKQ